MHHDMVSVPIKGLYKPGDEFNYGFYQGDVEVVIRYVVERISPHHPMTYECRMISMSTSRRRNR